MNPTSPSGAAVSTNGLPWSPEQNSIFTQLTQPTGPSLLVVASAGSGKTTTIVEAAKLLPDWTTNRFLAFNKNIATELETRLPRNCVSSTFHSGSAVWSVPQHG